MIRNKERAQRAYNTLVFYKSTQLKESGPVNATELQDLLVDMQHFCDSLKLNFAVELGSAMEIYLVESEGLA